MNRELKYKSFYVIKNLLIKNAELIESENDLKKIERLKKERKLICFHWDQLDYSNKIKETGPFIYSNKNWKDIYYDLDRNSHISDNLKDNILKYAESINLSGVRLMKYYDLDKIMKPGDYVHPATINQGVMDRFDGQLREVESATDGGRYYRSAYFQRKGIALHKSPAWFYISREDIKKIRERI